MGNAIQIIRGRVNVDDPAQAKCTCGRMIILRDVANSCECGKDYNVVGDELATREQRKPVPKSCIVDLANVL
jgi:hypothetical protein